MAQQNDKTTVFFMLTVMAFAIVLVDDRWVRVGLGLLPALLLAERALMGSGVGEEPRIGAADRRDDGAVRGYIDDLLKHFREFYTTCHLMAGGQLEPGGGQGPGGGHRAAAQRPSRGDHRCRSREGLRLRSDAISLSVWSGVAHL